MKLKIGIISVFFLCIFLRINGQSSKGFNIDSSNYYDCYHQEASKTSWLQEDEALHIIKEVLNEYGIVNNVEHALYKITPEESIVVSVFCTDFNFGILFVEGHMAFPDKQDRGKNIYEINTDYIYMQRAYQINGIPIFYKAKSLPTNIFLLSENSYWYQDFYQNKPNCIVSKEIILKIFRQDVDKIINTAKRSSSALKKH